MRMNIFYEHAIEAAVQRDITVEESLSRLRGLGISGLECPAWRLTARGETKALFEAVGLEVESVYEFFDFPHDSKEGSLRKIDLCLETAAFFGADKILAVPGFNADGERIKTVFKMMNILCERARKYGVTVSVEDFDDKTSPCSTIAGLEYLMENVGGLGLTFDTGNFAYSLESAEDAYRRFKDKIVHVHLKDRSRDISRFNGENGKADLSGELMYPCEVGGGYIGIGALVERILSGGYSGSFSIEHFGAADQLGYAESSVGYLRDMENKLRTEIDPKGKGAQNESTCME